MVNGTGALAHRVAVGAPFPPYQDAPSDLWVLGERLIDVQHRALWSLGLVISEVVPEGQPCVWVADDLWFTPALLERFLAQCPASGGRARLVGVFRENTELLQGLDDGKIGLAWVPAGKTWDEVPAFDLDLGETVTALPPMHWALADAETRPLAISDALAHHIRHWTHYHRVNLLAFFAWGEGERRRVAASVWRSFWAILVLIWRAKSLNPARIGAAVNVRGQRCRIHPTAVVELSVLGDDVEIGPFAVVRGSWIGTGAKITEQCRVAGSIVGEQATIARGTNLQLSVALPGSYISEGRGHQMSVFGRDCFIAVGVTTYDLSFGDPIAVNTATGRVSSGTRFLGAAIGHRARLGPHVRIGYGEEVPNGALIVGNGDEVARKIPETLDDTPHRIVQGRVVPLRRT